MRGWLQRLLGRTRATDSTDTAKTVSVAPTHATPVSAASSPASDTLHPADPGVRDTLLALLREQGHDVAISGDDYAPVQQALTTWARRWIDRGFEWRKQYVLAQPIPRIDATEETIACAS